MKSAFAVPFAAGLLAVSAIFSFCVQRDTDFFRTDEKGDPLFRMLGTAREALGDVVFMQADSYLHGGLRGDLLKKTQDIGESEADEDKNKAFSTLMNKDWVGKIYSQVNVVEHRHLEGEASRELLPILDISTRLNPHNVTVVLTAAYWFKDRLKMTDKALEILRNGVQDNPDSWEIEYQIGKTYSVDKKDFRSASTFLESAMKKLDKTSADDRVFFDPIRVRYELAEALILSGKARQALIFYREAEALYRGRPETALKKIIEKKIQLLTKASKRL